MNAPRRAVEIVKADYETECDDLIYNLLDLPTCLHTTCDAGEYSDFVQDSFETIETDDDFCSSEYSITNNDPGVTPIDTRAYY